ncbi:MAG: dTDP-4-dehydrorhamnose 3,5-epimerase [Planctomycetota bacterium]
MQVTKTALEGVLLLKPEVFADDRGAFCETFHRARYAALGVDSAFVQDNLSRSRQGVLRGLHYQLRHPQAKLITVVAGEIFDVAVDIRRGSPTFGRWTGAALSDADHSQIFIPPGFAHGFAVLSEEARVWYRCSDAYYAADDRGILWSDPRLGIEWPVEAPILSDKDRALPPLSEIPETELPLYKV